MTFACCRLLPVLALAILLAACGRSGPAYDLPPGIYGQVVDMTTTLGFSPQTVMVKAGEAVLWRNQSLFAHTVTFDPAQAADRTDVALPVGVEPFSSGDIPQGETFARKLTVPGTYRYVCRHHQDANMEGTIIVTP
jgi:plastocyanin